MIPVQNKGLKKLTYTGQDTLKYSIVISNYVFLHLLYCIDYFDWGWKKKSDSRKEGQLRPHGLCDKKLKTIWNQLLASISRTYNLYK